MMRFITTEQLADLRHRYPVGCRVRLLEMDDQQAPPIGTCGTVTGVDDTGSIMVAWDNGGSLHVLYGIDRCQKIYELRSHNIHTFLLECLCTLWLLYSWIYVCFRGNMLLPKGKNTQNGGYHHEEHF